MRTQFILTPHDLFSSIPGICGWVLPGSSWAALSFVFLIHLQTTQLLFFPLWAAGILSPSSWIFSFFPLLSVSKKGFSNLFFCNWRKSSYSTSTFGGTAFFAESRHPSKPKLGRLYVVKPGKGHEWGWWPFWPCSAMHVHGHSCICQATRWVTSHCSPLPAKAPSLVTLLRHGAEGALFSNSFAGWRDIIY